MDNEKIKNELTNLSRVLKETNNNAAVRICRAGVFLIESLEKESEARRQTLFKKEEELRTEWKRAEVADAEIARLKRLLNEDLETEYNMY